MGARRRDLYSPSYSLWNGCYFLSLLQVLFITSTRCGKEEKPIVFFLSKSRRENVIQCVANLGSPDVVVYFLFIFL